MAAILYKEIIVPAGEQQLFKAEMIFSYRK